MARSGHQVSLTTGGATEDGQPFGLKLNAWHDLQRDLFVDTGA